MISYMIQSKSPSPESGLQWCSVPSDIYITPSTFSSLFTLFIPALAIVASSSPQLPYYFTNTQSTFIPQDLHISYFPLPEISSLRKAHSFFPYLQVFSVGSTLKPLIYYVDFSCFVFLVLYSILIFLVVVCFLSLESRFHKGESFFLQCSLLYSQSQEQCLAHGRYSIKFVAWMH